MKKEEIWEEQQALMRHLERTLNCYMRLREIGITMQAQEVNDMMDVLWEEIGSGVATLEIYQIPGMVERIERAEEDIKAGRTRPLKEFLEELEKKRKEKENGA